MRELPHLTHQMRKADRLPSEVLSTANSVGFIHFHSCCWVPILGREYIIINAVYALTNKGDVALALIVTLIKHTNTGQLQWEAV